MKWNKKNNFESPNIELTNQYNEMINNNIDEFIKNLDSGKIQINCLNNEQQKIISKYRSKLSKKNSKEAIRTLFKFMADYKILLIVLAIITIISVAMSCLAIFTLKYLTELIGRLEQDATINNTPITSNSLFLNFCLFGGFSLIFYFLNAATMWWQSRTMAKLSQKIGYGIRQKLFRKIQKLPVKYFDQHSSGDLMSKFTNDVNNITNALSENLTILVNGFFMILAMFITMFLISPYLTLITLAIIPVMYVPVAFIIKKSKPSFAKTQKYIGELNGFAEEMISGQSIITLYRQEENINKEFIKYNDKLNNESQKSQSITSAIFPIANFFINFSSIIITFFGIIFVVSGVDKGFNGIALPDLNHLNSNNNGVNTAFTAITTIATFSMVSRNFFQPVAQISNITNILLMALAGANRAFQVFDEQNEVTKNEHVILNINDEKDSNKNTGYNSLSDLFKINLNNNQDIKYPNLNPEDGDVLPNKKYSELLTNDSVKVKDLNFSYVPNKQILFDVNIDVKPGQTIAIVGPTGSGKSTFINLLTKFYDIHDGDILIGDKEISIKEITKFSMRKNVSIVLQDTFLFNVSIKENIRYGKLDATDDEIINAAKTANAHNFIMQLPNGYNTVLNDNGDSLSQGQRQLLAIARAVLSTSNILILDEATSSIDTKTELEVQTAMARLTKNKTSFVIAHRLSTIEKADQILVLKDGRIIERGTHQELIEAKGFYYNLHNSQFYEE
ncbi:MAG: ABC transporter ATP-binding protein/permease [Candidatus Ureaplasma intestinipullorum]|uniref:ABC transporter ATP-binding protein/permease n=1 Tax=Candidatus Ureaplasma intestinipullorum TaxID=2838770 RepID=A0A9E2KW27_9BACT|nr:ABC transporter ATP-binding protein/permease [Candidatus Ureaplasma intestinipullorum]